MKQLLYLVCSLLLATSCAKEDTSAIDTEKPQIADGDCPSPVDCQEYGRGETLHFSYLFIDNVELGNFNIEIHNNFDHHSHSTSAGNCPLDPKKKPVNPWVYNQDFPIPAGEKSYAANVDIPVPKNIDAGDYHLMIRLTDRSGWQQLKAVSIKVLAEN